MVQAAFGVADHRVGDRANIAGGLIERGVNVATADLQRRPPAATDKKR